MVPYPSVGTGTVAARADALGVTHLHLSISHDAGIASAMVVAEGEAPQRSAGTTCCSNSSMPDRS